MEVFIFSPPKKHLDHELKTKLNGKKLSQTNSFQYLGIHLHKFLPSKHLVNNVAIKLNKTNVVLSKIRHYVDIKI